MKKLKYQKIGNLPLIIQLVSNRAGIPTQQVGNLISTLPYWLSIDFSWHTSDIYLDVIHIE